MFKKLSIEEEAPLEF